MFRNICFTIFNLSVLILLCLFSCTLLNQSFAAYYQLELIHPKTGLLSGNHRIYRAYPGIEYNIKVAAIGGDFPYKYTLSNQPSGMSIDSNGVIVWNNPTQSASNITVRVTDSNNNYVEGTWSINVTTTGFRFIDSRNGDDTSGNGLISTPWRTINKAMSTAAATDIIYFRTGTYTNCWSGDGWMSSTKSKIWLGYPNESATVDFGSGARLGITTSVYFDNLRMINAANQMFYLNSAASNYVFRRLTLQNVSWDGASSNPAFFRIERAGHGQYLVLQDSDLSLGAQKGMSMYAFNKMLIENNTFTNFGHTMIDLKEGVSQFTVRRNTFNNTNSNYTGSPLMGCMNADPDGTRTYGEVSFNLIKNPYGIALSIPMDDFPAGVTYIYRNTIVGDVRVGFLNTNKGPFYFTDNIIVNNIANSDGDPNDHIYNVTGYGTGTRLLTNGNLVGNTSSNILDASGNLTSSYTGYLGYKGWQVSYTSLQTPNVAITNIVP